MKPLFLTLSALFFFFIHPSLAQKESPIKFGKVSVQDFDVSPGTADSNASAVILADMGTSSFEGNNKGDFTLVFKHQQRTRIVNKNGFEAANVEIPLYFKGS